MNKQFFLAVCVALVLCLKTAHSQNVFASFVSFMKSKINSKKEVSKIIQMDHSNICLTNSEHVTYSECSCSFKKLKEFEKKCSSNFKRSQEDAKACAEEKCELCCRLAQPNESAVSILESELLCKKKCSKSDIILTPNDEDYREAFKKIIEFIRIFYPSTTLNYYPIESKTATYTNRHLGPNIQRISEDLSAQTNEEAAERIIAPKEETEELFSPYAEI